MRALCMAVALVAALDSTASAAVRLPAVLSDHMVLQQQMPLTVWGWADPGEKVDVTFRAQRVSTTTERDGRWQVSLAPEAAGGPFELTVAGSSAPIRLTDVLVGEVWLASGQSNMQWTVARAQDGQAEIARATHARIRLFSGARVTAAEPRDDVSPASWAVTSPETIAEFSAVGYFFARALQESRNVPIGIKLRDKFATNWELSTTRATSVVRYLIEEGGVNRDMISAAGYADTRPVATNDSDDGKASNRRIEIVLYPKDLTDSAKDLRADSR